MDQDLDLEIPQSLLADAERRGAELREIEVAAPTFLEIRDAFRAEFGEDWCQRNIKVFPDGTFDVLYRSESFSDEDNRRGQAVCDALLARQREKQIERSARREAGVHGVTILGPDELPRVIPSDFEDTVARKADRLSRQGKPTLRPKRTLKVTESRRTFVKPENGALFRPVANVGLD